MVLTPDLSISTPPTSLASNEEEPPIIQFRNRKELCWETEQVSGDFLIVQNVSPTDFEEINNQEPRRFRLRRYHADLEILITTIPTGLHEALHIRIYRRFDHQLGPRGIETWKSIGRETFRPRHPRGDGGEGDSCGGPKPARKGKGAWPTLVVEAGDSESLGALRDDMRWWFSASEHQVKIVLLAKFDHLLQRIIIERWEEELQTRSGATTSGRAAASSAVQPALRQTIIITWDPATDLYHVDSGALILSFRLLFLRDPGPQEGDIIISIAGLQAYARDVWEVVV
ncbi:hypothetical protein GE09DRAFT_381741 [Coniochaeta sp. 2T2.1]|nr:hypothetical protein GE09DRAFT_381741 [Coniochaeta sp. 2T2.1]